MFCPFAIWFHRKSKVTFSLAKCQKKFDMLKNTAELQNWLTWWTQDGREVIVIPFHQSLCWFHHVHLVMFFHYWIILQVHVHLQYVSMGMYHHEFGMLKSQTILCSNYTFVNLYYHNFSFLLVHKAYVLSICNMMS